MKCRMAFVFALVCGVSGCYNQQFQYKVPVPATPAPNTKESAQASVGVIEFDDMGELWTRCNLTTGDRQECQLKETTDWIAEQRQAATHAGSTSVVIVFVHGWNHNAKSTDANLVSFRQLMQTLQDKRDQLVGDCAEHRASGQFYCHPGSPPVPVRYIGVYVGWRGRALAGNANYLTPFDRESSGKRVASVSATEVVFRLREEAKKTISHGAPEGKFVLIGHSFGGLVVERTVAQALTAAIVLDSSTKATCSSTAGGYEPFADLITLINPAIEALETQQLIDMMKRSRFETCPVTDPDNPSRHFRPPLIVSVKARNDWATGGTFRILHTFEEADKTFRSYPDTPALTSPQDRTPGQRTIFKSTVGYTSFFHNYCYVDDASSHDSRDPVCNRIIDEVHKGQETASKDLALARPASHFSQNSTGTHRQAFTWIPSMASDGGQLSRLYTRFNPDTCTFASCDVWNNTPYWSFTVPSEVINGHNGFWTPQFEALLSDIVEATAQGVPKRVGSE
jgi:pimeloyl-ACP methyl ester carboxylesterase